MLNPEGNDTRLPAALGSVNGASGFLPMFHYGEWSLSHCLFSDNPLPNLPSGSPLSDRSTGC